jgi:hypothetical protein
MRKALVVGIDHYSRIPRLFGCVNDAHSVKAVLERHADGTPNFGVRLLTGTSPSDAVTRADIKDQVAELFRDKSEIALFYFAGHGHVEAAGGYLCGNDASRGDDGLPLSELITLAHGSPAVNKILILDSCHAGAAGTHPRSHLSELSEGMTILTASTAEQYASENRGAGVFTTLLVDAMNGAAGNLVGDVTPGSVYAHIDQSLGPWEQRPVFKTNVQNFVSLRRVLPPVSLEDLHRLAEHFPTADFVFPLDPTYEPEMRGRPEGAPDPVPEHCTVFASLQRLNRVGLVRPEGAPHMWHAAIESKGCGLTVLGVHWRNLVVNKRI